MNQPSVPDPAPIPESRERTVRALCAHFAADALGTEEFERRLELAYKATSPAELAVLTADLPALAEGAAAPAPRVRTAAADALDVRERQAVVAVMGGVRRRGHWTPARQILATAVMGGVELDFREARFGPGITEVVVFALMGGVEIIVPPDLPVESGGIGLMGGFDSAGQGPTPTDPDAPRLRIQGVAIMGGVEVHARLPGETGRDARRRVREERRARTEERRRPR